MLAMFADASQRGWPTQQARWPQQPWWPELDVFLFLVGFAPVSSTSFPCSTQSVPTSYFTWTHVGAWLLFPAESRDSLKSRQNRQFHSEKRFQGKVLSLAAPTMPSSNWHVPNCRMGLSNPLGKLAFALRELRVLHKHDVIYEKVFRHRSPLTSAECTASWGLLLKPSSAGSLVPTAPSASWERFSLIAMVTTSRDRSLEEKGGAGQQKLVGKKKANELACQVFALSMKGQSVIPQQCQASIPRIFSMF